MSENHSPKYAWGVWIGCIIVLFCTIGMALSSFSVYQPFFISERGFTNAQASSIILIRNIFSLIGALFIIPFYKRTGYRLGLAINIAFVALGFFTYGISTAYWSVVVGSALCGTAYTLGGMVAVSVLLTRWFQVRKGFVIGVSAAFSGFAAIIVPPIATVIIESRGLNAALLCEAALIAVLAVISFFLLKDNPDAAKGWYPLDAQNNTKQDKAAAKAQEAYHQEVSRSGLIMIVIAFTLLGGTANVGYAHYSVLYSMAGFSSFEISMMLSTLGIAMMVGKVVYGTMVDRIGVFKTNCLAFGLLIIANGICAFAGNFGFPLALTSMFLMGFGMPLATNGLSMTAMGLSSRESYPKTLNSMQIGCQVGALIFAELPGLIADAFGSYAPSYVLFTILAIIAMILVQITLFKNLQREQEGVLNSQE